MQCSQDILDTSLSVKALVKCLFFLILTLCSTLLLAGHDEPGLCEPFNVPLPLTCCGNITNSCPIVIEQLVPLADSPSISSARCLLAPDSAWSPLSPAYFSHTATITVFSIVVGALLLLLQLLQIILNSRSKKHGSKRRNSKTVHIIPSKSTSKLSFSAVAKGQWRELLFALVIAKMMLVACIVQPIMNLMTAWSKRVAAFRIHSISSCLAGSGCAGELQHLLSNYECNSQTITQVAFTQAFLLTTLGITWLCLNHSEYEFWNVDPSKKGHSQPSTPDMLPASSSRSKLTSEINIEDAYLFSIEPTDLRFRRDSHDSVFIERHDESESEALL